MHTLRAILLAVSLPTLALFRVGAGEMVPRPEHPRPDCRRDAWQNLNGPWQFRFDAEDRGLRDQWPLDVRPWKRSITVPFPWQSELSGIADTSGPPIAWYRRTVTVPDEWQGRHVWLCFGAVRHEARVWVGGCAVGRHEGSVTPFAFDITKFAPPGSEARIDIRVFDPSGADCLDSEPGCHEVAAGSGIWQTVWLESRPASYIDGLRLTPTRPGGRWVLEVEVDLAGRDGPVEVVIGSPDATVSRSRAPARLEGGRAQSRALLEVDNPQPWSPTRPHLYPLELSVTGDRGQRDVVQTYFGLRTIGRGTYADLTHECILLNGEPLFLRGAIDRSLNAGGLSTAPSDAFLRRDLELARELGLNLLKIRAEAQDPRRLYWADKLGMLLWQEMPSAKLDTEPSRAAWQATVRTIIRRDRNHPALIGWTLFRESLGIGEQQLKADRTMQAWVHDRVREVKEHCDPSRLVEDNATSHFDHVVTDVNSWQFDIDDYWVAREHIGQVVASTRSGSSFNYVPGLSQGTAPLVCGRFTTVPPRGGDVSWALRFLVTQLRRHSLIQGHIVSSLYDTPGRRDGLLHFDRSPKPFGYDAFVPGMKPADLHGPDFLGFDAPPLIETAPGEELALPVFVSHYSDQKEPVTLRWQVLGTDDLGRPVTTDPQTRDVAWQCGSVAYQAPLRVRVPEGEAFVGALAAELLDAEGRRIAANYVNLLANRTPKIEFEGNPELAQSSRPRLEVLAPRLVAVRIPPREFASFHTDKMGWDWFHAEGKVFAFGNCEIEYRIALPDFVRHAIPTQMVLMAELASFTEGGRQHDRTNADPPSDREATPAGHAGSVGIYAGNHELWQIPLPGNPADSRGVLSHHAKLQRGSYGILIRRRVDLTRMPHLREDIYRQESFPLIFRTEGPQTGLAIYGRQLGQTIVDPTLVIQTARQLDRPVGFVSYDPVTIDHLLEGSRLVEGIGSGSHEGENEWRMTTTAPPDDWTSPDFDDSAWPTRQWEAAAARGPAAMPGPTIWLRAGFELSGRPMGMVLRYRHEEPMRVYLNGRLLIDASGASPGHQQRTLTIDELSRLQMGRNTLAVEARQTGADPGFDLALRCIELENR